MRGDKATTEESKKLDGDLLTISKEVYKFFKQHFIRKHTLTEPEWIKFYGEKCGGFRPDGGFWICMDFFGPRRHRGGFWICLADLFCPRWQKGHYAKTIQSADTNNE